MGKNGVEISRFQTGKANIGVLKKKFDNITYNK